METPIYESKKRKINRKERFEKIWSVVLIIEQKIQWPFIKKMGSRAKNKKIKYTFIRIDMILNYNNDFKLRTVKWIIYLCLRTVFI